MPMIRGAGQGGPRSRAVRRVLLRVLVLNLALVAMKGGAWWSSRALSVIAEAVHSSLDALNNVLALGFARVAREAPDAEHPYGHQKFETLGALMLVGILSVTVFELAKGAVTRLLAAEPPPVEGTPIALVLMGLSALGGLAISVYETRRGRELDSPLLLADAAHTRSDVYAALAVLGGLVAVRLGMPWADPWITLAVAGAIAWTGWRIIRETVPELVDERAADPERIRTLAEGVDGVQAAYGIRSRGRAGEVFSELTIAVPPRMDVQDSHRIADRVEARLTRALRAREVVVHVEPAEEVGDEAAGVGDGVTGVGDGAADGSMDPV